MGVSEAWKLWICSWEMFDSEMLKGYLVLSNDFGVFWSRPQWLWRKFVLCSFCFLSWLIKWGVSEFSCVNPQSICVCSKW